MGGLRKSAFQVKSTVIDFLEFGGAVGTYGTGLFFDAPNSTILLSLPVFRDFTSGGLATVSFGWRSTDLAVPVADPIAFVNAAAFGGFVAGPVLQAPINFLSQNAVPVAQFAWELTFTIGVAPLTDYNVFASIIYISLDM
jgi:hypothetical protein